MVPQQKAQELVNQYRVMLIKNADVMNMVAPFDFTKASKEGALITANQMLSHINGHNNEWFGWNHDLQFWEDIKLEIEKL